MSRLPSTRNDKSDVVRKWQGDLGCADFIPRKFEVFMAVQRRTRRLDLCPGGLNLRMRTKNNPRPALGAGDA
jgi:hypothetical protein